MIKKIVITLIQLTIMLPLVILANDSDFKLLYEKNKHSNINLLFVHQAQQAILKNQDGNCYQLTLSGLPKQIIYFADQPNRESGDASMREFVHLWQRDKATPNVVLHAYTSEQQNSPTVNLVFSMSQPNYDAKNNALKLKACSLSIDKLQQTTFYRTTLFYDPYCLGCTS